MLYKSPFPKLHCIRLLGENIAGQGYFFTEWIVGPMGIRNMEPSEHRTFGT